MTNPIAPFTDELGTQIARQVYERSAEIWPHVTVEPAFVPAAKIIQSGKPRWLSAADTLTLYNAASFMMQTYGVAFNAHMTIVWRGFGVNEHGRAAAILSAFNKEAAAWLRVGDSPSDRKRRTKRSRFDGSHHLYAYVHENGAGQGIHTHQLMVMPPEKGPEFEIWAVQRLTRLAGRRRAQPYAVMCTPRTKGGGFAPSRHMSDSQAAGTAWHLFRYLTKTLPETEEFRKPDGGRIKARSVIKPAPNENALPVYTSKVVGVAEALGRKQQRLAGFRSKIEVGDWDRLYDGSGFDFFRESEAADARAILRGSY